jgi:hypothetical protein
MFLVITFPDFMLRKSYALSAFENDHLRPDGSGFGFVRPVEKPSNANNKDSSSQSLSIDSIPTVWHALRFCAVLNSGPVLTSQNLSFQISKNRRHRASSGFEGASPGTCSGRGGSVDSENRNRMVALIFVKLSKIAEKLASPTRKSVQW